MSKHLSKDTADALVAIARRVVFGIDCGDIRPERGAEKKLADLRKKAESALALAVRRREVKL